jgi:tellurite resistance protein TerC
MLVLDLIVFHRLPHEVSIREAAAWSVIWIAMGLGFAGLILAWGGPTASGEYLAGYLIEKSLSVDNIFVFALIFSYFAVPAAYQHRVLFLGIVGALVFRAIFIAGGAALLGRFGWMIYVLGGFLVLTGIKMARHQGVEVHPEHNPVLRLVRRIVPMTSDYRGQAFFTRENARRLATPMLAVLIVVETTDIMFAVDSIPAIFAVTREPFLVFTSNAFAILGLRALYFLLAGLMGRLVYLKRGLAVVLVFVGMKMMASDLYHLPIWLSLAVIALILGITTVLSIRARPVTEAGPEPAEGERKPVGVG